jgi:hypothetical protein
MVDPQQGRLRELLHKPFEFTEMVARKTALAE